MGVGLLRALGLPVPANGVGATPRQGAGHDSDRLTKAISEGVRFAVSLADPAARREFAEALRHAEADKKAALSIKDSKKRDAALESAIDALEHARGEIAKRPGLASAARTRSAETTPPLKSLTISPTNRTVDGSETLNFTATGIDLIGDPVDLTFDVIWTSSLPSAVSIGPHDGVAKAHPVSGTARITATHRQSRLAAHTDVTVTMKKVFGPDRAPPPKPAPQLQSLQITPTDATFVIDTWTPMKAMGKYSDGPPQDETQAVEWTSTADEIVSVDAKGVATAHAVGTATLTATDRNTMVTDWVNVQVVPLEVSGITIQSTEMTILPTDFQQFHAMLEYSNGTSVVLEDGVTWTSSDPAIVKIDDGGQAIGRKVGATELTATYKTVGPKGAATVYTANATVKVPGLTAVEVKPANPTMVMGEAQRFEAVGVYANGKRREVGGVSWTSADDSLIGFHGAVGTGHGVGKVEISVTLDENPSIRGKTTVTLPKPVAQRIRIEPVSPASFDGVMVRGDRMQFRALGVFAVGSGKEELRAVPVTWSSDNAKILTIDAKGLASSLGDGKAMLEAEAEGGLNVSLPIRVVAPSSAGGATPASGLVPPAVSKPYDAAKVKFDQLQTEVRALDVIPAFVRRLEDVKADIAKNPNRDAVLNARHAHDQDIAVQGVMDQIDLFDKSIHSAHRHIDSIEEATNDFKGRKKVNELRAKAKEEKERLKSWIDAVEVGIKMEENPAEAVVKLVGNLVDRFHVPVFEIEADELEGELDANRIKSLKADADQAKQDCDDAGIALAKARARASELEQTAEDWRRLAGEDFDDDEAAKGIFNFAELTAPLDKASNIVNRLAPDMRKASDAATLAIQNYLKKAPTDGDKEPGSTLRAMGKEAYRWRVQADEVSKQAESLRDQLNEARDAALAALKLLKPRTKTRPKKK
jgi:hypothetical protein